MTTKTAIAIRHLAFEDLGAFEPALQNAGYQLRYHDVGLHSFADLRNEHPDLLFVLGGPIGAYEEDRYPFLTEELSLIHQRLQAQRPLIGICLGAQLMARALGAKVYPGPAKEIGLAPIELTAPGLESCLRHFRETDVLHWHGDTFDLPAGATRLASTPLCQNQAFSYGRNALAFQFHPEAGGYGFERWLIGHTVELTAAGVNINQLRADWLAQCDNLQRRANACIADWLSATP